ncbi:hypothetical protein NESM_000536200 [Novymonas esmeraldas]|uniref:Uncharacterized protein n=1 Tax=Novymonas esmeraldas TaxID=1808958 RepID=A0AAW0ERA3_9TRYP
MFRLATVRLGGAVSRASAAAGASAAKRAPRKVHRTPARGRSSSKPRVVAASGAAALHRSPRARALSKPQRKVASRTATPKSARGRRGSKSRPPPPRRTRSSSTAVSRSTDAVEAAVRAAAAEFAAAEAEEEEEEEAYEEEEEEEAAEETKPPASKAPLIAKGKTSPSQRPSSRPSYMTPEREEEVMGVAERMQRKDTSIDVPVAAFAYEIIKAYPKVREMEVQERMDFLLVRWNRLTKAQKLAFVNDPLRGLL